MRKILWILTLGLAEISAAGACINIIGETHRNNILGQSVSTTKCTSIDTSQRQHIPQLYEVRTGRDTAQFWQHLNKKMFDEARWDQFGCKLSTPAESEHAFTDEFGLPLPPTHISDPFSEQIEIPHDTPPEKISERQQMNNHAVDLIRQGNAAEAIIILEKIEQSDPGHYETATNLGTALELVGDNEKALHHIQRGIAINPQSHGGSEWLHVLILKAKIKAQGDPTWFERNSIMGLPFHDPNWLDQPLKLPHNNLNKAAALDEVIVHIENQLQERTSLVPPKDPVVANIMFDLAHLIAIYKTLDSAIAALDRADTYGHPMASKTKTDFFITNLSLDVQKQIRSVTIGDISSLFLNILTLPAFLIFCYAFIPVNTTSKEAYSKNIIKDILKHLLVLIFSFFMWVVLIFYISQILEAFTFFFSMHYHLWFLDHILSGLCAALGIFLGLLVVKKISETVIVPSAARKTLLAIVGIFVLIVCFVILLIFDTNFTFLLEGSYHVIKALIILLIIMFCTLVFLTSFFITTLRRNQTSGAADDWKRTHPKI